MNKIMNRVIKREMKYKDIVVLKYRIEFPQLINSFFDLGQYRFNQYYRAKAATFQMYLETELYKEGMQEYESAIKSNYPFRRYEALLNYEITYNNDCVISLYFDQYGFTGGAHGSTVRNSQTWNLEKGETIKLQELFPNNPNYMQEILDGIKKQIEKQIKEGTNQYFGDYSKLVIEKFNPNSFYITPKGVTIYYQQYDIAPYSSGIPVFVLSDIRRYTLPKC